MFGRYRVLITVSAAFPVSDVDGEVVYNYRGTVDTAHFLGQLFRTFSQVLNLSSNNQRVESSSEDQPTSSFVTEPGENAEASTSSFPPNSKKKKRKRKRRVKKEAVMNQLVAVRQQSKSKMISLDNKGQNLSSSRWDTSAQTLLNMTLTFLRHVPERVISHPSNRGVISRLLDLTSPETMASFRSRTIHWSSLLALHLLHLCPVKLTPRLPFSAIGNSPSSSSSSPSKRSSPVRRFTGKKKKKKQSTSSRKHLFF